MKNARICIPIKKESSRIDRKNYRALPGYRFGLFEILVRKLTQSTLDTEFIFSFDDDVAFVNVMLSEMGVTDERIRIVGRPDRYCGDDVTTDDLCRHIAEFIAPDEWCIWTHVTSPFLEIKTIGDWFERTLDGGYDSACSVDIIKKFVLFEGKPLNFGGVNCYWPDSQDLAPVYTLNSAFFITTKSQLMGGNRIGPNPLLCPIDQNEGFDVDWPSEFRCVEKKLLDALSTAR